MAPTTRPAREKNLHKTTAGAELPNGAVDRNNSFETGRDVGVPHALEIDHAHDNVTNKSATG